MTTFPSWVGRYIGIPFRSDGHGLTGCNCWGLVRLVLLEQCKIDVPAYAEVSADDLLAAARKFSARDETWIAALNPRAFDVVLMSAMTSSAEKVLRIPGHVGIMVSDRHLLHIWAATDAACVPLRHPGIRSKILGFYRHRDLT